MLTQSDGCGTCGQNVPEGANFCPQCGTQVASERQSALPSVETAANVRQVDQSSNRVARFQTDDGECPQCWTPVKNLATFCLRCGQPLRRRHIESVPYAVAAVGRPAGLWTRGWAIVIDAVLIFAVSAVLWPLIFGESYWNSNQTFFSTIRIEAGFRFGDWQWVSLFFYRFLFLAFWGATPGKFAVRIRILNEHGERKIGVIRSFVRAVGWEISGIILFIGFLVSIFREDKRALHDLIAKTYPVILDPSRDPIPISNDKRTPGQ